MTKNNDRGIPQTGDIRLDKFRIPYTQTCWWCGEKATTAEHKFKHSDLRRTAYRNNGTGDNSIYKFGHSFEGILRSIKKGSQVRWGVNLCAKCNNAKSQPFDKSYDKFMEFYREEFDEFHSRKILDWREIYGAEWEGGVSNLARYFAKQFGCMMATENLPVPPQVIEFLNGYHLCPSFSFSIWRDERIINTHKLMKGSGDPELTDAMSHFQGLPETMAFCREDRLTGCQYQLRIGYMIFDVKWREGEDMSSFFQRPVIELPKINSTIRERLAWAPHQLSLVGRSIQWKLEALKRQK